MHYGDVVADEDYQPWHDPPASTPPASPTPPSPQANDGTTSSEDIPLSVGANARRQGSKVTKYTFSTAVVKSPMKKSLNVAQPSTKGRDTCDDPTYAHPIAVVQSPKKKTSKPSERPDVPEVAVEPLHAGFLAMMPHRIIELGSECDGGTADIDVSQF
jgi:hypothetical protein